MPILQDLASYRFSRYLKLCFLLWDLVLLNGAIAISFVVRYEEYESMSLKEVETISLLSNLFWIQVAYDYQRQGRNP